MKLLEIIFLFLAFATVKAMILDQTGVAEIIIPVLEVPEFEFIDLTGGCSSFTDCTEYLANVVRNIGEAVIKTAVLVFNLVGFIFEIFILVADTLFSNVEGAPWYVNLLLFLPYTAALGIIIYNMIRRGGSSD